MALQATSAAVDAGANPVATFKGTGFDQRGTPTCVSTTVSSTWVLSYSKPTPPPGR
ncbi:MAG: hypothetical protein QNL59_04065 [Actinomycetota bacterium]